MITFPVGFITPKVGGTGPAPYSPPTNGMKLWVDASVDFCYPGGTGSIVYDLSPNGWTGSIADTTYSNTTGFTFVNASTSKIFFDNMPGFGGPIETYSYVFWLKPLDQSPGYYAEASASHDVASLVYGYGGGDDVRPWYGTYYGMNPVSTPVNTLTMVAFTKDSDGVTNNYKSYRNGAFEFQTSADFVRSWANQFVFNSPFQPRNWTLWRSIIYDRALTSQEVSDMYTNMSLPS